jgi:hypothetical protein
LSKVAQYFQVTFLVLVAVRDHHLSAGLGFETTTNQNLNIGETITALTELSN